MSSEPFVGKLDDVNMAEIVRLLYLRKATGTLDLQHQKDQRRIIIVEGDIKSARSNRMEQKTGQYLYCSGVISEEQLREAIETKPPSIPLGTQLIKMELLNEASLMSFLRDMVREIIFETFSWNTGMFRFAEGPPSLSDDVEIHVSSADIIFYGVKRAGSEMLAKKFLGDFSGILVPNPDARLLFQHITLDPTEAQVLNLVDGSRSVEQVLGLIKGESKMKLVLLGALVASGLVSVKGRDEPQTINDFFSRFAGARPGAVQKGKTKRITKWIRDKRPKAEFTEKDIRMMRDKIIEKAQKIPHMNYYHILECPPRATQKEIHFSFMNLGVFYHPDLALRKEFSDLKPQLEIIFGKLEEAYQVLVDHNLRIKYDKKMKYLM